MYGAPLSAKTVAERINRNIMEFKYVFDHGQRQMYIKELIET